MSKEARYKMSEERLQALKEELHYLQTVREKEVAEQIKEARSFGDLSENSEYDEAKAEQGKLYSKIAEIKDLIEKAEVIDESTVTVGVVAMGSIVTVVDQETGGEEVYRLVGSQEANPMEGRISDDSPFGAALMGHRQDDIVTLDVPAGLLKFKIVKVERA